MLLTVLNFFDLKVSSNRLYSAVSQKVAPKKDASNELGFLSPTQGTSTPLWSSLTESQLAILVKDLVSQKTTDVSFAKQNISKQYIDREWVPWPILGSGWYRFEVHRKNGQSAGRCDVYYLRLVVQFVTQKNSNVILKNVFME